MSRALRFDSIFDVIPIIQIPGIVVRRMMLSHRGVIDRDPRPRRVSRCEEGLTTGGFKDDLNLHSCQSCWRMAFLDLTIRIPTPWCKSIYAVAHLAQDRRVPASGPPQILYPRSMFIVLKSTP